MVAKVKTGGPMKSAKAGGAKITSGGAAATTIGGGGSTTIGGGKAAPSIAPVGGSGGPAA